MNIVTPKRASLLGGAQKLGREIKSDRDLEKLVIAGLPSESVRIVADRITQILNRTSSLMPIKSWCRPNYVQ